MNNALTTQSLASKKSLLSSCVNDPEQAADNLLTVSDLSDGAKTTLSGLIDDYSALGLLPFAQAYAAIVTIENSVISSGIISPADQRVILIVASIMRYSLYHSCCGDTDWGKSVGNIVAALAGAMKSNDLRIEYSLITSIAGLEKSRYNTYDARYVYYAGHFN